MDTISNVGSVCAVHSLLSDLTVPYWIAGGWAIDLAAGRVTRDHADVDVMMLERDKRALWSDLTEVDVQPVDHELDPRRLVIYSKKLPLPTEVFLARGSGTYWVYRRGTYSVSRPLADITHYRDGIPFLAPEVVLLFKSRSTEDKDRHDVETALPILNAQQRTWLHDTLAHIPHGQTARVPDA